MVSCDKSNMACEGGYLNKAWKYLEDTGIAADSCIPYTSGDGKVETCPQMCADRSIIGKFKCEKGSTKEARGSSQIKSLIADGGPVETGFTVYSDFFNYKSGVYHHTSGSVQGGHAVKILGWGVDEKSGYKYWICANSWGNSWGEQGFFRIKEGDCGIDQAAYGCKPQL